MNSLLQARRGSRSCSVEDLTWRMDAFSMPRGRSHMAHGSFSPPHGRSQMARGSISMPHRRSHMAHGGLSMPHGTPPTPLGTSSMPHGRPPTHSGVPSMPRIPLVLALDTLLFGIWRSKLPFSAIQRQPIESAACGRGRPGLCSPRGFRHLLTRRYQFIFPRYQRQRPPMAMLGTPQAQKKSDLHHSFPELKLAETD